MKFLYLEKECRNFSTVILGSSRATGYRSADVGEQIGVESGEVYNYAVQADTILGAYQKIKWLSEKGCVPERILLPISIDRIVVKDYSHTDRLILREPPEVLGIEPFSYDYFTHQLDVFKKYLFSSTIFEINYKKIRNIVTNRDPNLKYFPSSGDTHYYFDHPCEKLSRDIGVLKIDSEDIENFLTVLKNIYNLTGELGVEVFLIWNPQLYDTQMAYEMEGVRSLLQAISQVYPEVYRLPLTDARLQDIDQYHDCSHFKKNVGKRVLEPNRKIEIVELIKEFEEEHLRLRRLSSSKNIMKIVE